MDEEAGPSEALADEVGARVVCPHPENEEDDPAALGAEAREWRGRRQARAGRPETDDEPEERDVDRSEDRREPRRQTLSRIRAGECPDRSQDGADGDEDHPAALQ